MDYLYILKSFNGVTYKVKFMILVVFEARDVFMFVGFAGEMNFFLGLSLLTAVCERFVFSVFTIIIPVACHFF